MCSRHVCNSGPCWLHDIICRELSGKVGKRGCGWKCWRSEGLYGPNMGILGLFYRQRVKDANWKLCKDRMTYSGRSFVRLELLQVQVLYEVYYQVPRAVSSDREKVRGSEIITFADGRRGCVGLGAGSRIEASLQK